MVETETDNSIDTSKVFFPQTEKLLKPISFGSTDYIVLKSLKKGEGWWASPFSLRTDKSPYYSDPIQPNFVSIDGVEFWKTRSSPSHNARREVFRRFPESKYLGKKDYSKSDQWELPGTDFVALILKYAIPENRLIFLDEEAKLLFEYLIKRFFVQQLRASTAAEYKINQVVPDTLPDYQVHPIRPLSEYQRVALQLALGQDGYALFMDKGTGKTAVSISTICHTAKRFDRPLRVLVVCPNQVRLNWVNEARRFATIKGRAAVLRGTPLKRVEILYETVRKLDGYGFSMVIAGYDTVPVTMEALSMIPWDMIILDESHRIKSPKTKRFKALYKLGEETPHKLILTGTPIGNSPMDLWSQLEFLGKGYSGFSKFNNFANYYGEWESDPSQPGVQRLIGFKNAPLLQERLAGCSFSITKEEAGLNLPEKVFDIVEVTMTKQQQEMYDKLAAQLIIEIEASFAESGPPSKVTANHVLTKLLRLAQITSGFLKFDDRFTDEGELLQPGRIESIPGNPKLAELREMVLEENPKCKIVIWAVFIQDIKVISEMLTQEGIKHGVYRGGVSDANKEACVEAFNKDPEFRVIVANPASAGEGLDLLGYDKDDPDSSDTYAGHVIWYAKDWSAINYQQAIDRVHRRGTRMPVRITSLICPGSIDWEIHQRLELKEQIADAYTNLQDIMKSISEQI